MFFQLFFGPKLKNLIFLFTASLKPSFSSFFCKTSKDVVLIMLSIFSLFILKSPNFFKNIINLSIWDFVSVIKSSYLKTRKGKDVLETTLYMKVPARDDDVYIITTEGDRLDILANVS